MLFETEKPFRIMNKAGLALEVSDDRNFIVGEYVEPIDEQTWFFEQVQGGWLIKSKAKGKYIGVQVTPIVGVPLITVDREYAKVWDIEHHGDPQNYQIRLRSTTLVMEFSKDNLRPGTQAKLAQQVPEEVNKVWVINLLN
ncbi:hypothetical protein EI94DRAFT_1745646 [Lactarius quietus]|nr:hypothetical protein EI94DRAFT_1753240 [Lactarius quietus]KAF8261619.1 hypothetical protein EI94DRAFT_1745646 [Lactarius quietus]